MKKTFQSLNDEKRVYEGWEKLVVTSFQSGHLKIAEYFDYVFTSIKYMIVHQAQSTNSHPRFTQTLVKYIHEARQSSRSPTTGIKIACFVRPFRPYSKSSLTLTH